MPRKPTGWFRDENRWFYTTTGGKQVKLSMDKAEAEAEKAFHSLMMRD